MSLRPDLLHTMAHWLISLSCEAAKNPRNVESSLEAPKQGYTNFYKKNYPG